jgi:hypothetical protein
MASEANYVKITDKRSYPTCLPICYQLKVSFKSQVIEESILITCLKLVRHRENECKSWKFFHLTKYINQYTQLWNVILSVL